VVQELTANPPKKPVASAGLYLPNRILHLLDKADRETNSKKRLEIAERALELARPLRKQAGESPWWAISFAIVSASLLVFGVFSALQPEDFYQVTERHDDYNLTIQRVHRGKPSPPWVMSFCSNTPAPFEAGHTSTALDVRYDKDKVCYALDSFSLLRDKSKCPVVPRNCMHTDCANRLADHVICYGTPQFN